MGYDVDETQDHAYIEFEKERAGKVEREFPETGDVLSRGFRGSSGLLDGCLQAPVDDATLRVLVETGAGAISNTLERDNGLARLRIVSVPAGLVVLSHTLPPCGA